MIERSNPLWEGSRVPHPCQAWSRQTCLWIVRPCSQRSSIAEIWRTNWKVFTTRQIEQILYGRRIPEDCWNRTNIFLTKDTAEFSQLTDAVACREYTLPRTKKHLNQKVRSGRKPKLGPYWKLQPIACTVNTELRLELCLWTKTILTHGSEFLMDQTSLWWIWTTMSRKFQKFSSKNMR